MVSEGGGIGTWGRGSAECAGGASEGWVETGMGMRGRVGTPTALALYSTLSLSLSGFHSPLLPLHPTSISLPLLYTAH